MRQAAEEAVKDWMIKLRRHDSRAIGGDSDLLLMMPALRQLSSGVKPIKRRRFSRPTNAERGGSKRVERLVKARALLTRQAHHVDQHGRAQTSINRYALFVQTIDQCNHIL